MDHSGMFRGEDLIPVPRQCCPQQPTGGPFAIGEFVHLNSGSPDLMAVDLDFYELTVAWKEDGVTKEMTSPYTCFHRAKKG